MHFAVVLNKSNAAFLVPGLQDRHKDILPVNSLPSCRWLGPDGHIAAMPPQGIGMYSRSVFKSSQLYKREIVFN
jgi:hypothetical protein